MLGSLEVADVFRSHGPSYREDHKGGLGRVEAKGMGAIAACRTAVLGGHLEQCEDCRFTRPAYNSCRNRHCPKCQGLARAAWLEDRRADLLPAEYFHVVFTLPTQIAQIAFQNKKVVYDILFRTAAETLRVSGADPKHLGAELGVVAVLHSWGQNLHYHPHLHCIVPGGGPSLDGARWVSCRPGFFLPVRVLSSLYRRLFLESLQAAFEAGALAFFGDLGSLTDSSTFTQLAEAMRKIDWITYAKPPFVGPEQVLAYLGRYTHRVAIANSRLVSMEDGKVTFKWKDYRHHGKSKLMTLDAAEFIRRFLLHTLPDGFHRIRHYGLLANGCRGAKIGLCRRLLDTPPPPRVPPAAGYRERYLQLTGRALDVCPCCGGSMVSLGLLRAGQPHWSDTS